MLTVLAAFVLAALPLPGASAAPICSAADPAVMNIAVKLVKRKSADHYVITATVTNIGAAAQDPGLDQTVVLVRNGVDLAPQSLPSLGAGVAYDLAFAIDRPKAERKTPLAIGVRYALHKGNAARNNCSSANDALMKSF